MSGYFTRLYVCCVDARLTPPCDRAGEIREYRDTEGRVIAFAHEARKGRVIRGQWFYSTDAAASSFVWFHSVRDLVARAIEIDEVRQLGLEPEAAGGSRRLGDGQYGHVCCTCACSRQQPVAVIHA
jgi:hypothetical protein